MNSFVGSAVGSPYSAPRWHLWLNVALFQAGWFACVLSASRGQAWLGAVAAVVAVSALAIHGALARRAIAEFKLVALISMLGTLADSLLLATGWIAYSSGVLLNGVAPYWIAALWALFATTLNVSMRWLRGRVGLAMALGAVGGPLSYWGAARLGAVQFVEPLPLVIALALIWAAAMPACIALAQKLDGVSTHEDGAQ